MLWSFDRDAHRQFSVHYFLCELITLPSPPVHIRASFFPANDFRSEQLVQFGRDLFRGLAFRDSGEDVSVPDAVQVWRVALCIRISQLWEGIEIGHGHAISALVIVRCGVYWLVQVAYKVDEEAQG